MRTVYGLRAWEVARAVESVRENQIATRNAFEGISWILRQEWTRHWRARSRMPRRAGQRALRNEPRAAAAAYEPAAREVHVRMHNGASFNVPVRMLDELDGASDEDLAGVEVPSSGFGLHWPALDAHIALTGILDAAFGSVVRSCIARKAGSTRSSAKSRASRENGRKGARPRKE